MTCKNFSMIQSFTRVTSYTEKLKSQSSDATRCLKGLIFQHSIKAHTFNPFVIYLYAKDMIKYHLNYDTYYTVSCIQYQPFETISEMVKLLLNLKLFATIMFLFKEKDKFYLKKLISLLLETANNFIYFKRKSAIKFVLCNKFKGKLAIDPYLKRVY